jgi:hypothetical protein
LAASRGRSPKQVDIAIRAIVSTLNVSISAVDSWISRSVGAIDGWAARSTDTEWLYSISGSAIVRGGGTHWTISMSSREAVIDVNEFT